MLTVYGTGRIKTDRIMRRLSRSALVARYEPIEAFWRIPKLPRGTTEVMLLGILRGTALVYKHCVENNIPFYYLDNPYFVIGKTKDYLRVTKNNFCRNSLGDYPDDRLKNFNVNIEDWKTKRGDSILVLPPTYAMSWFFNQYTWLTDTVNEIKKHTDRPIIIRQKPFNPAINHRTHQPVKALPIIDENAPSLEEDLLKAHCLVTFNSNSAIQALQKGIPVICNEQCSAYPLTNSLQDIENLTLHNNRQQLFNTLSYSQFSEEEIKTKFAFNYV